MNNVELARTLSWRELEIANTELWAKWKGKTHFSRNEKNVFVKPNEQCRACSYIVMARIGNRQHGALGEVERQNALFKDRKKGCWAAVGRIIYRHWQNIMPLLRSRKNVVSLSIDNKKGCAFVGLLYVLLHRRNTVVAKKDAKKFGTTEKKQYLCTAFNRKAIFISTDKRKFG